MGLGINGSNTWSSSRYYAGGAWCSGGINGCMSGNGSVFNASLALPVTNYSARKWTRSHVKLFV